MNIIDLKSIKKDYRNKKNVITRALRGLDLCVKEGEFVAIMGRSGSGKSTLMNIIGLLDSNFEGEYSFKSKDVKNLSGNKLSELRGREIGFVFQQFNLLKKADVLHNVLLPTVYRSSGGDKKRAESLINKVGLKDKIRNKSNELSVGQIQRVAIARALMMNPSVILADEPTGNLDTKTAMEVMDLMIGLNKEGKTLVIITHEQDIAAYANRIVLLKDGLIDKGGKRR
ncbi:ABC transporter ATP-binding protein [Patescibacteria group bacterium]|nr:ABC transporter ATP-binding protein [Patescibacteria group bacterium]MBU1868012.1 ABC transporter ATP-binding protein [Patescibacteria group bacterium]